MPSPIYWAGSGSTPVGKTPYGYFDDDDAFIDEAPRFAKWVCNTLGYPVTDIELTDSMIYTQFEQAITEFSSQVNEFNLRENMMTLQGISTGSSITQKLITGSPLGYVIEMSNQYGSEAGSGGNVTWHKGYIDCSEGTQIYDLQALWAAVSESGNRLEIRRIFHDRTPAISRGGFGFGDAGVGPTDSQNNMLGQFGWAGYDGGLSAGGGDVTGTFLMMPVFETLLRTQAIEFNDMIRRSQYSFEIHNNRISIFPSPLDGDRLWFQYTVAKDRFAGNIGPGGQVSDFSNAPYTNMPYTAINDVGKRWIRKYGLALCKQMLGRVLSKYERLPIPDQEVTLDGAVLRQEATQEIEQLMTQLRESLEQAGRAMQMEKMSKNEEFATEILKHAPTRIYIG